MSKKQRKRFKKYCANQILNKAFNKALTEAIQNYNQKDLGYQLIIEAL